MVPKPAKTDSRACFGIAYFTTEADAARYAEYVRQRGDTYNGGYCDGMACGRDTKFDHDADGQKFYAVTEA
jgi:hypothetical protein